MWVQDILQDIGPETMLPTGTSLDCQLMEISFSKYLVYRWLDQIFVAFMGILLRNFVQDGTKLVLSILSCATIIMNKIEIRNLGPLELPYSRPVEKV